MANVVFDVRGDYPLHQSNGFTVRLHVHQVFPKNSSREDAVLLKGTAQANNMVSVDMNGETREEQFFLVIVWDQGSVGEYHGRFNAGRLSGITFDRSNPTSQATWFIDRDFRPF